MSEGKEQLNIEFYYDDRVLKLSRQVALMLVPHMPPGTKTETVRTLADRVSKLAEKVWRDFGEPAEPMRCHTCDELTVVGNRVRVPVCNRCSLHGRSP